MKPGKIMKVYVIRHGQSETNRDGLWTGWLDAPLTEEGINDAQKASEYLKGISFEKIFTSDLCRAKQTAENAIPNCVYETLPLLREINVGSLENQPLDSLTAEQKANVFQNGYIEFGGESRQQFGKRVTEFTNMLEAFSCDNIAVFTHAGWLCRMLSNIMEVPIPRKHLRCDNCTIGIFEYENKNWRLHSWINL